MGNLAVLLIMLFCWAWECSNGQGITTHSVLLYWAGRNSTVKPAERYCDLFERNIPEQNLTLSSMTEKDTLWDIIIEFH
ncbi:hypothetical protein TURU_004795 [Turdus rufiventris]|nr:hypothetical protein TURU_004795 [Turdus rufiventris]